MIEENFGATLENSIEQKGEVMLCTSGFSMFPMLRNRRDMVVITRADRPLVRGDVPVYRMPSGKLIMHRILKVRENDYIIRGDNTYALEYVPKSYVVGVLKAFYRGGKYCDCANSRKYKIYVFFNRISYPMRYLWKIKLRPLLAKIKRKIIH